MNSTPTPKHLFQFELVPVEKIAPWRDSDGNLSLSLYALTDGHFSIAVGNETLLRYTPEIIAHWELDNKDAGYQVACFAQDVLTAVSTIISPIPTLFENIVRDEALFRQLKKLPTAPSHVQVPSAVINELEVGKTNSDFDDEFFNAFRWSGERSVWLNYFAASPDLWFVRVGDEVWIQWDNVDKKVEGIEVWTARRGTYAIPVQAFLAECRSFAERLLSAMESIIVSIEDGSVRAQIPLDTASLRNELLKYKDDFEEYLSRSYEPDVEWEEAERAVRKIALRGGVELQ